MSALGSAVLDGQVLEPLGDQLELVDGALELLEQLFVAKQNLGVDRRVVKQLGDRLAELGSSRRVILI